MERPEVHLIVLHHGLWGVPMHLDMMRRTLEHKFPEDTVRILNCDKSPAGNTYDGVDVCGDRLVDLVKTTAATENVTKLSLIGYSLGGLIVRYAAGRLYQEGFFDQVQPMNLVTIATPHLGSWRLPQGWMDRTFNRMVPIMTSRTGYQLVMADAHAWGLPLIYLMSHKDLVFYKALQKFKQLMLFANIQFDRSVPFCTAAMTLENPYEASVAVSSEPAYPSLVQPAPPSDNTQPKRYAGRALMGLWLLLLPLFLILWVVMVLQGKRHYAQAMKKKMGMEFSWLERSHQRDDPERQQQQQKQQQQEQQQEASGPRAPASLAGSSAARASEDASVESASASGAGSQDGADQLDHYAEHLPHMAKGKRGSARRQSIEADVTEVDLQIVTTSEQTSALPGAQHMFHFDASPPRDIAPSGADEADAAGRGDAAEPGKHSSSSSSTSSGMMHIIDHEGLVESNSRIQEMQKLMVSHMSQLPWRKVDVDTGHYHAHAAIVCRDRRFGEFGKDVLRYCADNLVL